MSINLLLFVIVIKAEHVDMKQLVCKRTFVCVMWNSHPFTLKTMPIFGEIMELKTFLFYKILRGQSLG